tara:strand:- start:277 stop:1011 length:735 start_codon:yes stop_codon:yes gene_type:complete
MFAIIPVMISFLPIVSDDIPPESRWFMRVWGGSFSFIALVIILKLHWKKDASLDHLKLLTKKYFNSDGFGFIPTTTSVNGSGYLLVYFQNQFDHPCHACIAIRPGVNFFMNRANIQTYIFNVKCPAMGYGVVQMPIGLPRKVQGKKQTFEVGCSVQYPQGKGQRVCFNDGIYLRANSQFKDEFGTALKVASVASGSVLSIVTSKPASIVLKLPDHVAEQLSHPPTQTLRILWQSGDPPLQPDNK